MEANQLIGDVLKAYSATEHSRNGVKLGTRFFHPKYMAWFIYLKVKAATSTISAKYVAVSLGTSKSAFECQLPSAAAAVAGFAGARAVGADDIAAGEYGWFLFKGPTTLIAGSDTTTADDRVVTSNQAAGKVEAMAASVAGHQASFGEAETTTSSGDVKVNIDRSVWG